MQLSGRADGRIQFTWSDAIKWDSRNNMCEAVKTIIATSGVETVQQNKLGCWPTCDINFCVGSGTCHYTHANMWRGPSTGNIELWTHWSDGGYSQAMWFHWEVHQVGDWYGNVYGGIGWILDVLGMFDTTGLFSGAATQIMKVVCS